MGGPQFAGRGRLKTKTDILFISAFHTPFIQDDLDTLALRFRTRPLIGHGILQLFRILLYLLDADVVFCWFASVYASIAILAGKLLGKKTVVVVGGVDVAKEPSLEYGTFLSPWKAALVGYALRRADRVLVVDETLRQEVVERAAYEGANIEYAPTGYDPSLWKPGKKKNSYVLTVAVAFDEKRAKLKGIDTLIGAARKMPKQSFVVVGIEPHVVAHLNPPKNMTFKPPVTRPELLSFYREAKVYCQPSRREGLSNSLCEAMLCGCIPVATKVGGNPTAVGSTGILVPRENPALLAAALKKALGMPGRRGQKARERIMSLFPKDRREKRLWGLVEELAQ